MDVIKKSATTSLPLYSPELGFSFQSFWKSVYISKGMLYRKEEHVVLLHDGIEK